MTNANFGKTTLLHVSRGKINELKYIKQISDSNEKIFFWKPNGLWYSPGREWLKWSKEWIKKHNYKYYYVVVPEYTTLNKPDKNKVLKISNSGQLDDFTFKYGKMVLSGNLYSTVLINWGKVAKNFGGIEIIPHIDERSKILTMTNTKKE